jgi:hypothetical protein
MIPQCYYCIDIENFNIRFVTENTEFQNRIGKIIRTGGGLPKKRVYISLTINIVLPHFLFEFLHLNTLFIYFEVFKNVNYLFNLLSILFLY